MRGQMSRQTLVAVVAVWIVLEAIVFALLPTSSTGFWVMALVINATAVVALLLVRGVMRRSIHT